MKKFMFLSFGFLHWLLRRPDLYPRPEGATQSADTFDEGIVKTSPLKFDDAVSLFRYLTKH